MSPDPNECLFVDGRPKLLNEINRLLAEVMTCPHCHAPVRARKLDGVRFLQSQTLDCRSCGLEHDFPLFLLLSKTKWTLFSEDDEAMLRESPAKASVQSA